MTFLFSGWKLKLGEDNVIFFTNNSLEHYNSKFKSNFQKNINIIKIIDIQLNEVLNPENYII